MTSSPPIVIGIMSGTSADGIDVAIVRCDEQVELLHFSESPMPQTLREMVLRLANPGSDNEIDIMGELDRELGHAYAAATLTAIQQAGLQPSDISAIGCHGQTIRHRPKDNTPFSLQIGCASTLTEITGITSVSDFRSRDIAAGGEGAPLVPFAHSQLFASDLHNTAIVNIGGIANITWLSSDGKVTGFDIGPGNMLMDGLISAITDEQESFDYNGRLAASGQVCEALLTTLIAHPFLTRTPPKSTGREMFGETIIQQIIDWPELSDADRLATACSFTADAIADSISLIPQASESKQELAWLICGGGARNQHLMTLLREKLAPATVESTDEVGISAQAVEAISFALLARATLMGAPNTLSAVTGANHDVCGGQITPGNNWSKLLNNIHTWSR